MKLDVKPSFPTAFMRYVNDNKKYLRAPQVQEAPAIGHPGRVVGVLWSNKAKRQSDSLERLAEAYFRAGYTRDDAHEAVAAILGDRLSRNYWEDTPGRVADYALPILSAMHDRGDITLGGSALVAFFTHLSPYGQAPQAGEPPQGPAGAGPGQTAAPGRQPPRDQPEGGGPEGRRGPPAGPRPGQPAEGAPRQGHGGYVALGFGGLPPPGAYNPFPNPFSGFHPALATRRGQKTRNADFAPGRSFAGIGRARWTGRAFRSNIKLKDEKRFYHN